MRIVPLARILWRSSRARTATVIACALLSGVLSAGVIALVSQATGGTQGAGTVVIAAFAVLVLAKIATNALSRLLLVGLSEDTVMDLSLAVCSAVLRAPLRAIEKRGIAQIHTSLTDDVSAITWAVQCLPMLVT